ncbi:SDR family oxidoreductase [Sabulibacter ruber]|uniref:SDR family oxidoreductase n=1 Tax=Sabulibacter ruber TaxID=2811901 RepID=UPI001A96D8CE|nr:SDR family oxidoreductase [Sabulibacter ruber]
MEQEQSKSLADKVVVITGASSGIGRATAVAFAREGASLVLAARRTEILEQVVADCTQWGGKAVAITTDVAQTHSMQALAEAALAFGGKIDIWINNAGAGALGAYDETPMAAHEQVVQINLLGHMRGAHAVLPIFKLQEHGHLINTISIGAFAPMPYAVAYAASKYGLRGFSEALRAELSKFPHIQISDVFPAFIDTPGFQHAGNYIGKKIKPAPPVYEPQLVAEAIVSLARKPKPSVMVGGFGYVARLYYALFPKLTRTGTARFMERYFERAESVPITDGSLFQPSNVGADISGGWRKPKSGVGSVAVASLLAGGIATSLFYLAKKR